MPDWWYRGLAVAITRCYFRRVRLLRLAPAADDGAVLYVALHRNGAVDEYVYRTLLPGTAFLVAPQLLATAFHRFFFTGIPGVRRQDRDDRSANAIAVRRCVSRLAAGKPLVLYPEGTSDLGPRHLPFTRGAAQIAADALAARVSIQVIPLGIFYYAPDRWRSDVVVIQGPPLDLRMPTRADKYARVDTIHGRITKALETLGVDVATPAALERVERFAALVAPNDPRLYCAAQQMLAGQVPPAAVLAAIERIEHGIAAGRLATARGVPLLSPHPRWQSALTLAVQLPIVALAALANIGPLAAAWSAGRRLAGARNKVTLWRILAGAPIAALWVPIMLVVTARQFGWLGAAAYILVTVLGTWTYPKLIVRWCIWQNVGRPIEGASRDLESIRRWLRETLIRS